MAILVKIKQFFCNHDWTCKAEQGIAPDPLAPKSLQAFYEYATMYCSKCGKISELSQKYLEENNNDK